MSRLRSDRVVNKAGTGAPELTYGAVVPATGTISGAGGINLTGVVTATSYRGDGSQLTGIDASSLKDGSNIKIQAQPTGATVTGILTVTNDIDANDISGVNATFSGNLTVQGTTTTIDTATLNIEDRNIGIASVSNPSDTTADGAGLTIFAGADGNKILQWVNIGDGKWQFVGGTVEASNFVKGDGTPVAGDSDITSCLFV